MLGRENPKYKHVKKDIFHAIKDSSLMKRERNEIVGIQNVKILLEMVASNRLTPEGISTVNGLREIGHNYSIKEGWINSMDRTETNLFCLFSWDSF